MRRAGAMHDSARDDEALAGHEFDDFVSRRVSGDLFVGILFFQIDEELAVDDIEKFVVVVVLVPVVLALDDAHANDRVVHFAKRLIEPFKVVGRGHLVDVDEFERAVEDVEAGFVGVGGRGGHGCSLRGG